MNKAEIEFEAQLLLESGNREIDNLKTQRFFERVIQQDTLSVTAVFVGLSILVAISLVSAQHIAGADAPRFWGHGLIALGLAQSALIVGATLKLHSDLKQSKSVMARIARKRAGPQSSAVTDANKAMPAQSYRQPDCLSVESNGQLDGRQYVKFLDGTVEIATMLGRRRFSSLDMAKEFVGVKSSAFAAVAATAWQMKANTSDSVDLTTTAVH
jgi:hypothetical protein